MARKSISLQLSELREYTAKLEVELAGYREMASSHTHRYHPGPSRLAVREAVRSKAVEYCKAHGVKSCSKEQLDNWVMPY